MKQRVLLQGRSVAAGKYAVRAFPTTFLIDRAGKIVQREVGFSPSTASGREKMIGALIEKQERRGPRVPQKGSY